MPKTLFRGSDDGFTFIGAVIFLLILLLLVPTISALLAGGFKASLETLKERQTLFDERQMQLDAEFEARRLERGLSEAGSAGGGL